MTREPVLTAAGIQTAIVALVNLLDSLGVIQLDDAQMGAVNASLAAILPLLLAVLYTRARVTPMGAPQLPELTTVTTTDARTGEATGTTVVTPDAV